MQKKFASYHFLPLLVLAVLVGCSDPPPVITQGKVLYKGRGVFPATLLFKDSQGKVLPTATADDGSFKLIDVKQDKYRVAIQTPKLANLGTKRGPEADAEDAPEGSREATVPAKFKDANVGIPAKYESFDSSQLEFDFTAEISQDIQITLED
jgi:hypothetical protein